MMNLTLRRLLVLAVSGVVGVACGSSGTVDNSGSDAAGGSSSGVSSGGGSSSSGGASSGGGNGSSGGSSSSGAGGSSSGASSGGSTDASAGNDSGGNDASYDAPGNDTGTDGGGCGVQGVACTAVPLSCCAGLICEGPTCVPCFPAGHGCSGNSKCCSNMCNSSAKCL